MNPPVFTDARGVALGGYDPVAYFLHHEACRGSREHALELNGVTYYFTCAEHRDRFAAGPEAFLPAYGGFCAFAMAMGNGTVPADPRTFKLYNGRLYLFYNDYYEGKPFNTIVPWNADEPTLKARADEQWKALCAAPAV